MASEKLFETKDRDESHQKLEEILSEGKFPRAECREADEDGLYSVWSGPQREHGEAAPLVETNPAELVKHLSDDQMAKLAKLIAKELKG